MRIRRQGQGDGADLIVMQFLQCPLHLITQCLAFCAQFCYFHFSHLYMG